MLEEAAAADADVRRTKAEMGRLTLEAVAVVVALLTFAGESDLRATAVHTVNIIAARERMGEAETRSLTRAVETEIIRVASGSGAELWSLPAATLAVLPAAGHA